MRLSLYYRHRAAFRKQRDSHDSFISSKMMFYPFIVKNLSEERTLMGYPDAISVANHIDCMFFNGGLPC